MTKNEHLLAILAEECSEAAKEAIKCLRFGTAGTYPDGQTNEHRLIVELTHIDAMIEMLVEHDVLPGTWKSMVEVANKKKRVMEHMVASDVEP